MRFPTVKPKILPGYAVWGLGGVHLIDDNKISHVQVMPATTVGQWFSLVLTSTYQFQLLSKPRQISMHSPLFFQGWGAGAGCFWLLGASAEAP